MKWKIVSTLALWSLSSSVALAAAPQVTKVEFLPRKIAMDNMDYDAVSVLVTFDQDLFVIDFASLVCLFCFTALKPHFPVSRWSTKSKWRRWRPTK
jgi:hypothetical protein